MWPILCSPAGLAVSVVGLERALMQYCSQPQDASFDLKTVPIETVPLGAAKCEKTVLCIYIVCLFLFIYMFVYHLCCVISAMGETTPGASVQKSGGVAASKQDVYAGEYHMIIT